ncbi:MAG: HNH endonuclease, partial [Nocardioides sp.]|nr:HNH endonuclease [Nocardioides sp.]
RLEKGHRLALLEHVQAWCGDSHTRVSIRPVIDLNETLSAPGYAIPDRIRDHVITRDRTCRFPWCTQPAVRCDLDHVIAYDHGAEGGAQPGPTSTANLIPLCRRHHRLKTHTGWRVAMPEPGRVTWTSPHGHHFHVDHHGTTAAPGTTAPPRD